MKGVLDFVGYLLVRALVTVLSIIPHPARVALFSSLFRIGFSVLPRLRRTIDANLRLAFPDKDAAWRGEVCRKNATEMARLLADTVRLPSLSAAWCASHIHIPAIDAYRERLGEDPSRGILIATGHLGSFELLGHSIGMRGFPLAAVARKFRSARFDRWWTGLRERSGNSIIDRRGAFKEVVSCISSGRSVAILFDQNVTRNHATFVDWFGVPAATTKSVALAALRTEAPIFVASIRYVGNDQYHVDAVECDCADMYRDSTLSGDEKVRLITQRLSDEYCSMIRRFPEGWFWLHRRWKTRPSPEEPRIYR